MIRDKVLVGLSGGVDSSVSAYLLKKQGYEVVGFTFNQHRQEENKEVEAARKVADFLAIDFLEINIYEEFQAKVIAYFLDYYDRGLTPSPCIVCDDEVKFEILFSVAEKIGAKYVATGHYTSVSYNEKYDKFLLKSVHDIRKDQSYMLYRLDEKKLKSLVFPLAKYSKKEIREIAREIGLFVHDKKDSQGICFAKSGYKEFLKEHLQDKIQEGNFVDKQGKILGRHEGYQYYTLGQRRGLNINLSKPVFITEIKPEENIIVLGDFQDLMRKKIELINYKFNVEIEKLLNKILIARPRFSSLGFEGKIILEGDKLFFEYLEANAHNALGQHLVIFEDNFVLGGGEIKF